MQLQDHTVRALPGPTHQSSRPKESIRLSALISMTEYLREELEKVLPPGEVDAILIRVENRVQVDRELEALHLDPMHYHEALDRVHVASVYIETLIAEHPVIRRHDELAAICERACDALFDLYQAVGRMPDPS